MVNQPFFLTDGEDLGDENGGATLYLLHKEDGETKAHLVAHITDVPRKMLESLVLIEPPTNVEGSTAEHND